MQQVILLDKIKNLGSVGDQVDVKEGYARNFLFPNGKAIPATPKNIDLFKEKRAALEEKLANILMTAHTRLKEINELGVVKISSKAGISGKLFGSIGARDIASAISQAGVKVNRQEVRLPNGALRTLGLHEVSLKIHSTLSAKIMINILPE